MLVGFSQLFMSLINMVYLGNMKGWDFLGKKKKYQLKYEDGFGT